MKNMFIAVRPITVSFIIAFFFCLGGSAAQSDFPVLVRTITFAELTATASRHEVTWANPDGTREKMIISDGDPSK